jgi:hypothetical protein
MRTLQVTIQGISPYSQSRHYDVPKINNGKESPKDYEARTWRERMHVDKDGYVFIPPMSFKNCVSEAAKFLSMQIPGKGKSTYTKHFEAGVMVLEALRLKEKAEDVPGEWLFVPSDGRRGGSSRVEKCFPVINGWGGVVEFNILDETLMDEYGQDEQGRSITVFEHHLREAGKFIGVGRFRPRNNGYYGRFKVVGVKEV